MKNTFTPTFKAIALIVGIIIIVILTIPLIYSPDDDDQHNHFVGSGELNFVGGDLVKDFYDEGTVDSLGSGFSELYNCLSLRGYSSNDIIHFHHTFRYGGPKSHAPVTIKTSLIKNSAVLPNPSPVTIDVDIKKNLNFSRSVGNILNSNFEIWTTDFNGQVTSSKTNVVMDFHIPRSSIQPRDSIHLLFEDISTIPIPCPSCNHLPITSLEYYACVESPQNNCDNKAKGIAIFKVIAFCAPFGPAQ